jgi:hypothetical protein
MARYLNQPCGPELRQNVGSVRKQLPRTELVVARAFCGSNAERTLGNLRASSLRAGPCRFPTAPISGRSWRVSQIASRSLQKSSGRRSTSASIKPSSRLLTHMASRPPSIRRTRGFPTMPLAGGFALALRLERRPDRPDDQERKQWSPVAIDALVPVHPQRLAKGRVRRRLAGTGLSRRLSGIITCKIKLSG